MTFLNAGPSTPLKYASLRMTDLVVGRVTARTKAKEEAGPFDSAEVRFAQDDKDVLWGEDEVRVQVPFDWLF
jgi:hypothetical protein